MGRKKGPEKAPNHERWLVSYGDFITLLFAVFVTLYAMSQVDKKKIEEVAASYRNAFGITATGNASKPEIIFKSDTAPVPAIAPQPKRSHVDSPERSTGKKLASGKDFRRIKASVEQYLLERNLSDQVQTKITGRGLVISLNEAGIFDSGSASIKPDSFPLLAEIASAIKPFGNRVSFEGHTDNKPIHSQLFPSNWELSSSRATNIARHFIDIHGFAPELVSVAGFGEFRPVASNSTDEGRRQNRRVDIVIIGSQIDDIDLEPPVKKQQVNTPPPF